MGATEREIFEVLIGDDENGLGVEQYRKLRGGWEEDLVCLLSSALQEEVFKKNTSFMYLTNVELAIEITNF